MSAFTKLVETRTPFTRGVAVQRSYNRLSVDFLCHTMIRTSVRAAKIGKKPVLFPIGRNLRLPLLRRFSESEVL